MSRMFENHGFEKQDPILVTPSGEILEKPDVPNSNEEERIEGLDERNLAIIAEEAQALSETLETGTDSEKESALKKISDNPVLKKVCGFLVAGSLFVGLSVGNAQAASRDTSIADGFKKGAVRAGEDISRKTGQGIADGMKKGMEKAVLNLFGIATPEQKREMERQQREAEKQQQQMNRAYEQEERAYRAEIAEVRRWNDRQAASLFNDRQRGKVSPEEYSAIMNDLEKRYEDRIEEINSRYGRSVEKDVVKQGPDAGK